MGCGQSKINLYPRRNKNSGKGNSAKKSGVAEKETDEEEGSAGGAAGVAAAGEEGEEEAERGKNILPLSGHPPPIEISASQQDFFKMLDDKIDEGKDYDSSSETEVQIEQERRFVLMQQWRSTSQSTQSSQPSPPTPMRRRMQRGVPQPPDRQNSPGPARRCYRTQNPADGPSPPPHRAHSAQSHHQHPEGRQINGDKEWNDATKSPIKRPQSAGANWKTNPKVASLSQKPKKSLDANENQRCSSQKDLDQLAESTQDISQITYNPTFQTHSPAHSAKSGQQPYIAQIITYPMSQQVTPPSPSKYIAPPEEYQDPQNNIGDTKNPNIARQSPAGQGNTPPNVYYIHGSANSNPAPDLAQQRQQTAIHLQQYVAMKQAQQQMFSYLQRGPHTVYPNVDFTQRQGDPNRHYDQVEENFIPPYGGHPAMRPHSAPTPVGVVRPMPLAPGLNPAADPGSHMIQMSVWSHMSPVASPMGSWVPGQVPTQSEMQYYHQSQFMSNMYRPNSAGSAGTLTRYHKEKPVSSDFSANPVPKNNMCQTINLVRQKPVGQIVSLGGQELTVCHNANDSSSPASVSTDSGVSPGNNVTSSKNSVSSASSSGGNGHKETPSFATAVETKNKKNKSAPFHSRPLKNSKSLDST